MHNLDNEEDLSSTRGNKNAQVKIRELDENNFALDDTEDDLNDVEKIELKFDKELGMI